MRVDFTKRLVEALLPLAKLAYLFDTEELDDTLVHVELGQLREARQALEDVLGGLSVQESKGTHRGGEGEARQG